MKPKIIAKTKLKHGILLEFDDGSVEIRASCELKLTESQFKDRLIKNISKSKDNVFNSVKIALINMINR